MVAVCCDEGFATRLDLFMPVGMKYEYNLLLIATLDDLPHPSGIPADAVTYPPYLALIVLLL